MTHYLKGLNKEMENNLDIKIMEDEEKELSNVDKLNLLIEDTAVDARNNDSNSLIMAPAFFDDSETYSRWQDLYSNIAAGSLVHLVPSKGEIENQMYTRDLGIALAHTDDSIYVTSNLKDKNRKLALEPMVNLVTNLGFEVKKPKWGFAGEADLLYLRNNIYIGGHGNLSDIRTFNFLKKNYKMEVVGVELNDKENYPYLTSLMYPISMDTVMTCTELLSEFDVKQIEHVANIVDVDKELMSADIAHLIRNYASIIIPSNISELSSFDDEYFVEKRKIDKIVEICEKYAFEPLIFNFGEFDYIHHLVNRLNYNDFMEIKT